MQWVEGHARALTKLGVYSSWQCLELIPSLHRASEMHSLPSFPQSFCDWMESLFIAQDLCGAHQVQSCAVHWDPERFLPVATARKRFGLLGSLCVLLAASGKAEWDVLLPWQLHPWAVFGVLLEPSRAQPGLCHRIQPWICGRIPSQPACGYLKLKPFLFWCRFLRAQLHRWF